MAIRNDFYTIYKGHECIIYRNKDNRFFLLERDASNAEKLLPLGFQPVSTPSGGTVLEKEVTAVDNLEVYSIDTYGVYKGREFSISSKERDGCYRIISEDRDLVQGLDFEEQDRHLFFKWVNKSEVNPVYEKKTPYPNYFTM